jgi:hypothetical protein
MKHIRFLPSLAQLSVFISRGQLRKAQIGGLLEYGTSILVFLRVKMKLDYYALKRNIGLRHHVLRTYVNVCNRINYIAFNRLRVISPSLGFFNLFSAKKLVIYFLRFRVSDLCLHTPFSPSPDFITAYLLCRHQLEICMSVMPLYIFKAIISANMVDAPI